jgi:hypothetical protein
VKRRNGDGAHPGGWWAQSPAQRSPSVTVRINDLRHRIWVLERSLKRQAKILDRTLSRAEHVEEELEARIRKLEKELNRRSR